MSSSKPKFFPLGTAMPALSKASTSVEEFHKVLLNSKRIVALCGAGLSAASGLGTFRGAGGMWKNYQATSLATPQAFRKDPGLVWLFYHYRRHMALEAKPNAGHWALTELARRMPGFCCLTQNVDGLSQRTNHPRDQLKLLHGSLFDIKCNTCAYTDPNNFTDPFHPSLITTPETEARIAAAASTTLRAEISQLDPNTPLTIPLEDLPHCPSCKTGLLRPGVVWFGEPLPPDTTREASDFIDAERVDLCLVIGTTAKVYPAAGYVDEARHAGARIVVVNMETEALGSASGLRSGDFLFEGDASVILPEILRPVVGELDLEALVKEAEKELKAKAA